MTGTITYTPTTYTPQHATDTYSTSSVSPTSGGKDTAVTFSASSFTNDNSYIYGNLKLIVNGVDVKKNTGYASGYGGKLSISSSGTFATYAPTSLLNFSYYSTASRYAADPGDVSCTYSDVTASSAKVTVPSGITTTFLNSYYYITATDSGNVASSLTSATSFARSTGYINLTGLASSTQHKRYIYAYNSYNARYYKIGSVTFTTKTPDPSSYTATLTASSITTNSAVISISGLSSTTNLNSNWYLSNSSNATSFTLSASRSSNITLTGLNPNTTYTYYGYVYSNYSNKYYRVDDVTFTTDPVVGNYIGTLAATATGAQKATFTLTGPSDTTGLNSNWYLSTTNSTTATSLANVSSATRGNAITITNLSPAASNIRYAYVYNTSTSIYYQIASVTVKTHSYVYYGASLTPCWTYLG